MKILLVLIDRTPASPVRQKRTKPDYSSDRSTSVQRSGLVWYPDRGPDLAEFTRDLAPGGTGILTDVHLTEQAERDNAVGVSGMRGKAPYRGIGLGGERQDLPGLPEVCRAQHVPLFTRRGLAAPGEQRPRPDKVRGPASAVSQGIPSKARRER